MTRMNKTDDIRINGIDELLPPIAHLYELPLDDKVAELVESTRNQIADLIHGRDKRLLAVRPLLHPRPQSRPRIRPPPAAPAPKIRKRAAHRHARLF